MSTIAQDCADARQTAASLLRRFQIERFPVNVTSIAQMLGIAVSAWPEDLAERAEQRVVLAKQIGVSMGVIAIGCREFAKHLLMPDYALEIAVSRVLGLEKIATDFGVPMEFARERVVEYLRQG